jgi:CheY-like chemotaxis protein
MPAPAASDAVPSPDAAGPPAASGRGRLLLVDDEPLVLQFLARALETEWDIARATGGAEALALIEREGFDAVVCDLLMPGLSGMDLAARMAEGSPVLRQRMVFLTGGAVTSAAEDFVARADVVHLPKPVDLAELRGILRTIAPRALARR